MRILAIANETTMQTMHLIRFLFTRRLRIPATTVSHWTNNFSRRDSNKWKSDVQFFPCMSVTPATPPINATKFTFGHSSQFLAIFHSQICNRRKPFLTEKQKSKKKRTAHLHELSAIFSPLFMPVLLVLDEYIMTALFSLFTRKSTLLLATSASSSTSSSSSYFFLFPVVFHSLGRFSVLTMCTVLAWTQRA